MTNDGVSTVSLKQFTSYIGETYGAIVAGYHWWAFFEKFLYLNQTPIVKDLIIRKREKREKIMVEKWLGLVSSLDYPYIYQFILRVFGERQI